MKDKDLENCILTTRCLDGRGYGHISIDGVTHKHHRFAYAESRGLHISELKGMVVRHTCDNPKCINPSHLLIGTHQDNANDKVARGRQGRGGKGASLPGDRNGRAKLTWEIVRQIRGMTSFSSRDLAKIFSVDPKNIRMIRANRTWKENMNVPSQ